MRLLEDKILKKKTVLAKAITRLADKLNLTGKELAEIIGPSESTFSRLFRAPLKPSQIAKSTYLDPSSKEGQLAILLLRLYRNLDILFGGNTKQCELWLRSENKHLQGKPIEIIKSIEGMILVIQYLDAIRSKI